MIGFQKSVSISLIALSLGLMFCSISIILLRKKINLLFKFIKSDLFTSPKELIQEKKDKVTSEETKRRISEAQKKRWEKRKAARKSQPPEEESSKSVIFLNKK